jgi:hypothetical protein
MNLCLCATLAAFIFATIIYNGGKGLTWERTTFEIGSGEKVQQLNAVTVSPDLIIVNQTNAETKRDLLERFNQAKKNQVDGVWIVCIAYQEVTGLLLTRANHTPLIVTPRHSKPMKQKLQLQRMTTKPKRGPNIKPI